MGATRKWFALLAALTWLSGCSMREPGAATVPPRVADRASASTAADVPVCSIVLGGSLCTSVPRFAGSQVVDGVGDEFCEVPATVLSTRSGVPFPQTAQPTVDDALTVRVAWDDSGLHAHFHVDDPVLVRDFRLDSSWAGPDYVELDIGGTFPLTGFYDGETNDAGFMNVYFNPESTLTPIKGFTGPVPAQATAGFAFLQGTNYGIERAPLPDIARWAYRTVAGGYEFELYLPWALLGRQTAPAPGTTIALDLGLGTNDDPAYWSWWPTTDQVVPAGLAGQVFLAIQPLPAGATTSCRPLTTDRANPWCDDRTWCQPTLE